MKASIVINTLNRADSLDLTLRAICKLTRSSRQLLEVVVVNGPSTDHTEDVLSEWSQCIVRKDCPLPNLSISRNIGISAASGDIIAFLDDDSLPESNWYLDLLIPYKDLRVGAAGGPVFDYNGFSFQCEYETIDRFGNPNTSQSASPHWSFPGTPRIPHLLGANMSFRAAALREIGGFDEEYEYFLDESDVMARIVDHGYIIAQLPSAFVHHKSLPSGIRNANKVPTNRYPILKNKIYFCLKHSRDCTPNGQTKYQIQAFIDKHFREMDWAKDNNLVEHNVYVDFVERQIPSALRDGAEAHNRFTQRGSFVNSNLTEPDNVFSEFQYRANPSSLRIVLISKHLPPASNGGIARFSWELAASLSHECNVHVLTLTDKDVEYIEFKSGIWIHYIKELNDGKKSDYPGCPDNLPLSIRNWSYACLREYKRLSRRMKVDIVEYPIWDSEGIAFVANKTALGPVKLVLSLHTTVYHYFQSNPSLQSDSGWISSFYQPAYAAEKLALADSDGIRANSRAIIREIEATHDHSFSKRPLTVIHHGLSLKVVGIEDCFKRKTHHHINVLYVGRLEKRKGIDVLLNCIKHYYSNYWDGMAEIYFTIVGKDISEGEYQSRHSYQTAFCEQNRTQQWISYVNFLGEVSEKELLSYYKDCDIFVAPSRFESLGLVFLEAMAFAKPVIGTNIGGIPEVIKDGENGFLIESEDFVALAYKINVLISNSDLRVSFGLKSRQIFASNFTCEEMRRKSLAMYAQLVGSQSHKVNIVIAHSILAAYDGISNIIKDHYDYLATIPGVNVSFVGYRCDYHDVNSHIVSSQEDFMRAECVRKANIIYFHHGVYYDFLECIKILTNSCRCNIIFHNITPKEFLAESSAGLIDDSLQQLSLYRYAHKVYSISDENKAYIASRLNLNPEMVPVVGITAKPLSYCSELIRSISQIKANILASRLQDSVRICYIGRLVKSKGLLDLLEALHIIASRLHDASHKLELDIITNQEFSDTDYSHAVDELANKIRENPRINIRFHYSCDEYTKDEILTQADIFVLPSYHEGFGIPFIEAISKACLVVSYDNSNISRLLSNLGFLADSGSIDDLAEKIKISVELVLSCHWKSSGFNDYLVRCKRFIYHTTLAWDSDWLLSDIEESSSDKVQFSAKDNHRLNLLRDVIKCADVQGLRRFLDMQYITLSMINKGIRPGQQKWIDQLVACPEIQSASQLSMLLYEDELSQITAAGWLSPYAYSNGHNQISIDKKDADIAWGPYIKLYRGLYRVSINGTLQPYGSNPCELWLIVASNKFSGLLAEKKVSFQCSTKVYQVSIETDLFLGEDVSDVELKLVLHQGACTLSISSRAIIAL